MLMNIVYVVIELDQNEISSFINLIKECSTPLKLRKMSVVERYLIELEIGTTKMEIVTQLPQIF